MKKSTERVRYAVVGLGHIAQVAVLPAFAHAKNSKLAALISGDPKKEEELSRRYGVAVVRWRKGTEEGISKGRSICARIDPLLRLRPARQEARPDGNEGMADVRIVEAIFKSAKLGRAIRIAPVQRQKRTKPRQAMRRPPVRKPKIVRAEAPHPN